MFRLCVILCLVFSLWGPQAHAQTGFNDPESSTQDVRPQDMSPADLLRLFLPEQPTEQSETRRESFDRFQLVRTKRAFNRYRRSLDSQAERETFQSISELITLILTVKKITLDDADSEAIGREMARISRVAHSGEQLVGDDKTQEKKSRALFLVIDAPMILPDGATKLTYIDAIKGRENVLIRMGDRSYALSPNEGVDVPNTDGKCVLIYEDLNTPKTVAEFTYTCRK